ncbi:MAG TPA: tryptophan--tRNA ligase [Candidatus Saccharimonadales bacterium]|nr:tryptophan--tRNA ligase [Candidatus Saccharimonadales bacterium]
MSIALTGIRPTGDLTIANYVGAMQPIVDMQETFDGPVNVFVADIHGLTDQEPDLVNRTRLDTARSLVAAGIDPERTTVYLQSQIEEETVALAGILDRHTTVAELLRIPTLKEKLKRGQEAETATLALFRYPVLMAADICIQDATDVPVGEDQIPHIEFTRRVARRFNKEYGEGETVLVEPSVLALQAVRIAALNGDGKMSKSSPNSAIFLKDSPTEVAAKVKRAQTALPGEMTPVLESHFTLADALSTSPEQKAELAHMKAAHEDGQPVMKDFKVLLTDRINGFLEEFQGRYDSLTDDEVRRVLIDGAEKAHNQARTVLDRTKQAMGLVAFS